MSQTHDISRRIPRWVQNLSLCGVLIVCLAFPAYAPPAPIADATVKEDTPHFREQIALALKDYGVPPQLVVMTIATLPIVELRGAIPVGINLLDVDWRAVYVLAVIGNMLPVPFILLLLGPASRIGMKTRIGRIFFEWLFARTRRKSSRVEKYETLGLAVFVAIPLPVTGAWTGSMAAFLLNVKFGHACLSILLGVLCAGVIMTVLSLMGWLGAIIAGVVLITLAVSSLSRWLSHEERAHVCEPCMPDNTPPKDAHLCVCSTSSDDMR